MTQLTNANLSSLSITIPDYDRSQAGVGIVHFGVGGFHRAHQAIYVDALMDQGKALDWGICGVGVMPFDLKMRDAMVSQDCLYTLVLKDPKGQWTSKVIGSIVKYLYAPDDPQAAIEQMADPATRIVSLTVTEGGYNFHPVTGKFDADNPEIQADLAPGAVPATTFGLIIEAPGVGSAGSHRSPSCHATTSKATATSPKKSSRLSPACGIRSWATGWKRMSGFLTRWWTGSLP